jgi:Zn-dependent peptidase ImmA (M78 family)
MMEITEFVIKQANELTHQLLASNRIGHKIPPIFAEDYAALVDIKRIVKMDLGDLSALLLPGKDGYSIKVNINHHPLRQNFSCAHEIAHLLLDKAFCQSMPHTAEFRTTKEIDNKLKERLCERVAAELLMPESLFTSCLNQQGASVNSIQSLAHIFYTSIPATARRIGELNKEPCITLYWRLVKRPRWKQFKPCLIWSSDSQYEIPKFVSVSQSSSIFQAFQADSAMAKFESFPLGNIERPFYIESKGFGQKPQRYIISLVFPQRKKLS